VVSALKGPFGIATAAAAAFGVAIYEVATNAVQTREELNRIAGTMSTMGHAADYSREGVKNFVASMHDGFSVGRQAARELYSQVQQIPQATEDTKRKIVELGTAWSTALNHGADDDKAKAIIAEIAKAAEGGADGVKRFAQQWNLLDHNTLNSLDAAKRSNDTYAATDVLLQSMTSRLNGYNDALKKYGENQTYNKTHFHTDQDSVQKPEALQYMSSGPSKDENKSMGQQSALIAQTKEMLAAREAAWTDSKAKLAASEAATWESLAEQQKAGGYQLVDVTRQIEAELAAAKQKARAAGIQDSSASEQLRLAKQLESGRLSAAQELAAQVDSDKRLLQNANLTADERRTVETKLATDVKALHEEQNKPATGGASQVQVWRDELAKIHDASTGSKTQELAADVQFWASKAELARKGSRDQIEADLAASTARKQLRAAEITEAKQAAATEREIDKQNADTQVEIAKIRLAAEKQSLDEQVAAGKISAQQKIAIEEQLTDQIYRQDLLRLEDELNSVAEQPKEWARVNNEILKLQAQHNLDMNKLFKDAGTASKEAAAATTKAWEQALSPIGRAFSTSVSGIIQGSTTLKQAEAKAAQSLVLSWAESAEQSAQKWIASQLAKLTASQTTNAGIAASDTAAAAATATTESTGILKHAGSSAAAVYDDVAQIPYVGWLLAPPAAAAAFAAVAAFSAEGGWDRVPFDGAPAILHKNEMVLPASIANPMRSAALSGSLGGAGGQSRGDVSMNYAPTINGGSNASLSDMLRTQGDTMLKWLKTQHRNGVFG
jgi:hypothetical protein